MHWPFISSDHWLKLLTRSVIVISLAGCGPVWYGAPPPTYPPGQGLPSAPFQQAAPTPGNAPPLQVPAEASPGGTPPSTFQGNPLGGGLNEVPDASADQVLTVPTPKSTSTYHDVQQGETLSSIARQYGVTVDALKSANVFDGDPVLKPGDLILIP